MLAAAFALKWSEMVGALLGMVDWSCFRAYLETYWRNQAECLAYC
jgi:hypothetical protein